jgi:hypothetical protein
MNLQRVAWVWRLIVLAALVAVATQLTFPRAWRDRARLEKTRFELLPIASDSVPANWQSFPTLVTSESAGGERSLFRLGPLGLQQVEMGTYPSGVPALADARLCDSSNCDESSVVLQSTGSGPRARGIPPGTWRLRHDEGHNAWLVSFAATDGEEALAAAVARVPVPLASRRSPMAASVALCAAFLAAVGVGLRAFRGRTANLDSVLMGVTCVLLAASMVLHRPWAPPLALPSWDLSLRPHVATAPDWATWPLVDIVHGPFSWADTLIPDERTTKLGPFALRCDVALSRMPPFE